MKNEEEIVVYVIEMHKLSEVLFTALIGLALAVAVAVLVYATVKSWREEAFEEAMLERARAVQDAEDVLRRALGAKVGVMGVLVSELELIANNPISGPKEFRQVASRLAAAVRAELDRAFPDPPEAREG